MRKQFHLRRLLPVALVAVVATMMMGGTALAVWGTPQNHIILESGSDTSYYTMSALGQLYNESPGCEIINPTPSPGDLQRLDFFCRPDVPGVTVTTENYRHDFVVSYAPLGSGNGRQQMCDATPPLQANTSNPVQVDFVRSSSSPIGVCNGGMHGVAFAADAVTWECWPGLGGGCAGMPGSTTAKNLTQQNLIDIFHNCTVTNWNQVGGNNAPIIAYYPQDGSGTRSFIDGKLGTPGPCVTAAHKIEENKNKFIPVADRPNAIFPMATSNWNFSQKGDGSQIELVDGFAPSSGNISKNKFPFSRYIYNVFCDSRCNHGATPNYVLDYMGVNYTNAFGVNHPSNGWICKTGHAINPLSGKTYDKDIASAIKSTGMVALKNGATGGGAVGSSVCRLDQVL
jgi:ABC-type phosphate transport system substrate-binding protein